MTDPKPMPPDRLAEARREAAAVEAIPVDSAVAQAANQASRVSLRLAYGSAEQTDEHVTALRESGVPAERHKIRYEVSVPLAWPCRLPSAATAEADDLRAELDRNADTLERVKRQRDSLEAELDRRTEEASERMRQVIDDGNTVQRLLMAALRKAEQARDGFALSMLAASLADTPAMSRDEAVALLQREGWSDATAADVDRVCAGLNTPWDRLPSDSGETES